MTRIYSHHLFKHLIPWLLVAIYFYYFNSVIGSKISIIGFVILFTLNLVLTYYFLLYTSKFNISNKNRVFLPLLFVLAYIVFLSIDLLNFKVLFSLIALKTQRDQINLTEFMQRGIRWYFYVAIVAYAKIRSKASIEDFKNTIRRKENLLSQQLNVLKHQFHSHLNYNFINYCYGLLLKASRQKAEIITYYSDMLEYALKTHAIKKVSIKQEVEYLNNYMNFQSYFIDKDYHKSEINVDGMDYKIAPLLLGTLLEQAYKHAHFDHKLHPLKSLLTIQKGQLQYSISYTKNLQTLMDIDFEVIEQLKTFLLLRYPKNHHLDLNNVSDKIQITLTLNLNV